jgi:hypothetical protein
VDTSTGWGRTDALELREELPDLTQNGLKLVGAKSADALEDERCVDRKELAGFTSDVLCRRPSVQSCSSIVSVRSSPNCEVMVDEDNVLHLMIEDVGRDDECRAPH